MQKTILFLLFSFMPLKEFNYEVIKSMVSFESIADLEIIKAINTHCKGKIDFETKKFTFVVPIKNFEGFNSPLQSEHFHENYMETNEYPYATFTGKIIDDVNLSNNETITFRGKGVLNIHGVEVERVINGTLIKTTEGTRLNSEFIINLNEHKIKIPKLVNQKIAEEIKVAVSLLLNENK